MSQPTITDFLDPSQDGSTQKDQNNEKNADTEDVSGQKTDMSRMLSLLESTMNRLSAIEEKMSHQEKEQNSVNKGEKVTKRKVPIDIDSASTEPPKKKATPQPQFDLDLSPEEEIEKMSESSFFETLSDVGSGGEEEEESLDSFFMAKEVVGKKVSESLAASINNAMFTVVEDVKVKELCETVTRPENCTNLVVPKTNERIWKSMTSQQRGRDRKLQKTQMLSVKSVCKLTEMLDSVRESRKSGTLLNLKNIEQNLKDTIKLSAASYSDINIHRLENIQPKLPGGLKSLCKRPFCCNNDSDKSTELLFGKDLNQKIKEKNEEEKFNRQFVSPKNVKSPRYWMGEPRADQRASSRGKKPMGHFQKRGGINKRKFH